MIDKGDQGLFNIGVDIGGTKIEAALVNAEGKIIISQRTSTHAESGPDSVIAGLIKCIKICLAKGEGSVGSIGIGMAVVSDRIEDRYQKRGIQEE